MFNHRKFKQLFILLIGAILIISQAGFTGLQPVHAASLEKAATVSAIKEDGSVVLAPLAIEISEGDTAFDILEKADEKLESESYGGMGEFITGINGVQEEFGQNFWSFYINGLFQDMGASSTYVSHGDNIQFVLTTLGNFPTDIDVKVSAGDSDGNAVINEQVVSMPQNTTAYDALRKAATDQGVQVGVNIDSELLTYLSYLGEPLANECEYWAVYMNGESMQSGLLNHTIQTGDDLSLVIENWCQEPEDEEESADEEVDEEETQDRSQEEDKQDNPKEINYAQALEAVVNYLKTNPSEMDWYGFSALQSADVDISTQMADEIASSINEDYSGNATDYARTIITLTSAGYDATNVNGINLISKLMDENMVTSNQLVYSLLAIDSANYEIPEDKQWTREAIIDALLKIELSDGGWSFFGNRPSPDLTGMALLALSTYKEKADVNAAIDRAVQVMSTQQGDKGGYDEVFNGGYSAESAALVIIGLSAVGVDATSELFTKAEANLLEHLLSFQMEDGSFKHLIKDKNSSVFAVNQGALALVAYNQFKKGNGPVFKFNLQADDGQDEDKVNGEEDQDEEQKTDQPNESTDTSNKVTVTLDRLEDYETSHAIVVTPNNGTKQSKLEVSVDNDVLNYLIHENKALIIDNGDVVITIPVSLLKELSDRGEHLEVIVTEQEVNGALGAVYDVVLEIDSDTVSEFDNDLIIELLADEEKVSDLDSSQVKAFYFNEETEEWEVITDSVYQAENGFITFTTTHLSTFGVFKYDAKPAAGGVNNGKNVDVSPSGTQKDTSANGKMLPKTATNIFTIILVGLALATVGTVLLITQRRRKIME